MIGLSEHRRNLGLLPPPLRGRVGEGGKPQIQSLPPPPSLSLPRRKSGLPDLRTTMRNPGKPGFRGGGNGVEMLRPAMPSADTRSAT